MTVRLYDTAARQVRDFVSLVPAKASIYVCGATVQSAPHIGHLRSGLNFDILRRWLMFRGYEVTLVRNVTDIDDKILAKSAEAGRPWWAHAAQYERDFQAGYALLGCLEPTIEPRATGHITEMITLMQRLIDAGHAYSAAGDVYFDVRSWSTYGSLSGQRVDAMLPAGDSVGDSRKRDPRDFALWKSAKPGEPSWPTPWGAGRPGWHLECSAMAEKYLGPEFDIHGGGLDLIFPHHENELAQSASVGDGFARYWMHNAWVTMAGEKMSKSLGNTVLVADMATRWRPIELRYYLASAHYRSAIEYSPEALDDAARSFTGIERTLRRCTELLGELKPSADLPDAFTSAMDSDLGVPAALACVHAWGTQANTEIAGWHEGPESALDHRQRLQVMAEQLLGMVAVLGLDPFEWAASAGESAQLSDTVDELVRLALDQRQAARGRKDFEASDQIRDRLAAAGVLVEDTSTGPRWTLKGN